MNKRAYYTAVFLVAIWGLLVGIYLIPTDTEKSLMYLYDRRYDESYAMYQRIHERGKGGVPVDIPLVKLHLHFADTNGAIELLQKYVKEHPDNYEDVEYLGDLYKNANRPYEYLMNLSDLYRLKPSVDLLRKQAQLFTQMGDLQAKTATLKKIIDIYQGTQQEYRQLIYAYLDQNDNETAFKTAQSMIHRFPLPAIEPSSAILMIDLYLENQQISEAKKLALNYVMRNPKVDSTLQIADLLLRRKMYGTGLKVIEELAAKDQKLPQVQVAKINLLIGEGKQKIAYEFLKQEYDNKQLPISMEGTFLPLAITYEKNRQTLVDIINHVDVWRTSIPDLLNIAETFISTQNNQLGKLIIERLGPEFLKEHPILHLALSLTLTPASTAEEEQLDKLYGDKKYQNRLKIILAELVSAKNYQALTKKLLSQVTSLAKVEQSDLYNVVNLYIQSGLIDKALEMINEMRKIPQPKGSAVNEAWLLLATAKGQVDEVMKFLKTHKSISPSYLGDIFFVSHKYGHNQIALKVAEMLVAQDPDSNRNQSYLALALIYNDEINKGMTLFDKLIKAGYDPRDLYLEGLVVASKKEHSYRPQLHSYIAELLKRSDIDDNKRREYASILIDNGFKKDAATILFALVKDQPFESQDVQNLLFAWGENLDEEQIEWIAKRAIESKGKEKALWLSYLTYNGHPEIALGQITPQELENNDLVNTYIEAASALYDKSRLAQGIKAALKSETDLKRLKEFGELIQGYKLYSLEMEIYNKMLALNPDNKIGLRGLAFVYYNTGNFKCSRLYLRKYITTCDADYLAYYFYAEILWWKDKKTIARHYYRRALEKINVVQITKSEEKNEKNQGLTKAQEEALTKAKNEAKKAKCKELMLAAAQIYHRLGRDFYSIKLFNTLLQQDRANPSLRNDYANLMMDLQGYGPAAWLLGSYPYYRRENLQTNIKKITAENQGPIVQKRAIDHYQETLDEEEKNIRLSWVRFYKDTAKYGKAIKLVHSLIRDYPKDPEVLASAADVHYSAGEWRRALNNIYKAQLIQPQNNRYYKSRKDIVWDHLPFALANYEYRVTGIGQIENFFRTQSTIDLRPYSQLNVRIEKDWVNLNQYTNVQGITEPFIGLRGRGEVALQNFFKDGRMQRTSIYFTPTLVGAGLEWAKAFNGDLMDLALWWNRPNWDTIEGTIEEGTTDTIQLGRTHQINRLTTCAVSWSYNRYNLQGWSTAALTWKFYAALTYKLPQQLGLIKALGDNVEISLNWLLDKEQIDKLRKKVAPDGTLFAPLPIVNREDYSWFFYMSKRFNDYLSFDSFFGYTWDRTYWTNFLPIGGASVTFFRKECTQIKLEYSHTNSQQFVQTPVDSWIATIKIVF